MSENMRFSGTVDIQAAKSDGKRPTFTIAAYNGGPMKISGFQYPVAIDLAGLKASRDRIPILFGHDPGKVIGQSSEVLISDSGVTISGTVTSDDADGQRVVANAKNGFEWQASVGVDVRRREFIPSGRSVALNGRTLSGPLIVAREGSLYETSFVSVGADQTTFAAVAASKGGSMSDVTEQVDGVEVEKARVEAIGGAAIEFASRYPDRAGGIREIVEAAYRDPTQTDRDVRLSLLEATQSFSSRPSAGASPGRGSLGRERLECALLVKAGVDETYLVREFGEAAVEAGRRSNLSLVEAARHLCELSGISTGGMSGNEIIKASAFSTLSLPRLLGDITQRALLAAYTDTAATWETFAATANVKDFRSVDRIRPNWSLELEQLGKDGEIKHGTVDEEAYSLKADTYAKMFGVTRQDIINDDLGFLETLPREMARASRQTLANLVYRTILANGGSFFSAGNSNLLTAGSALDATSLGEAIELMRKRTDANGNSIALVPKVLVVPPELEMTARQLLNSAEINAASGLGTGNVLHNVVKLVIEPRLSNTSLHANASATQWYLFANPSDAAVTVAFLDGRRTPTIEVQDVDFNKLGIECRCYHDFGVALGDPRATIKATGAAA